MFALICITVYHAKAQSPEIVIQGRIINFALEPISFASVVHTETEAGTAADVNGEFMLEVRSDKLNGSIKISAVGFHAKEVKYEVVNGKVEFKLIHLTENSQQISQVIVTGEVKPTPVDSSIYKVKLISSEKIQRSGALNLNELLLTEANIRMSSDLILGSQIEMMGLDGQNVKIMVDGVPVIGRLDGNIDLSQINLDNIAQVEVIEGPMSVVYGNNALAGTINLITKQNNYHAMETKVKAYAETVGRYSGNLNVSQKLGKNTILFDGGYEYFSGVDFNTENRSMDWKPKKLYRLKGDHIWRNDNWKLNTKLGYYNDKLYYKGNIFEGYKAFDNYYYTNRFDASFGVNGKWNERSQIDVVSSYNVYNRFEKSLFKDLSTLETIEGEKEKTQDMTQWMLRGIYNYTFLPKKLALQSGVDLNVEGMKGKRIEGEEQNIGDYALFANLKYTPIPVLEFQPGARFSYNSDYDSPLVYSLNAKWNIAQKLTWRASVATGFRAPTIKELHYIFVDSNHEIYGNSDLEAESSNNFNSSFEFVTKSNVHDWKIGSSFFYNDISNLITLVQEENSTAYSYRNIESFQSTGGDLSIAYGYKGLIRINGGYGLTGRHNSYTENNGSSEFNLTHDYFGGLKITEPKSGIAFNADYKYNGSLPFFYTDDEDQLIKEGKQEAYQMMNASVSRNFFKHQLRVIVGAKNLFNVTTVKRVGANGQTHSGSSGTPVSYGRSFFVSLNYRIFK